MERCSKGRREVYSDSSDKTYVVTAHGKHDLPECSCVAYAIKRNRNIKAMGLAGAGSSIAGWCKHLESWSAQLCDWVGPERIDGRCPQCGAATESLDGPAQTSVRREALPAVGELANIDAEAEVVKEKLMRLLEGMTP